MQLFSWGLKLWLWLNKWVPPKGLFLSNFTFIVKVSYISGSYNLIVPNLYMSSKMDFNFPELPSCGLTIFVITGNTGTILFKSLDSPIHNSASNITDFDT